MYHSISKERQLRINKYYFDIDKKRALLAEVLLRYILDQHFAIQESDIEFDINYYGKPSLLYHPNIYFNYSHSGDWVVCAVGECNIGVDVEIIKSVDFNIAKIFFTPDEYTWLQSYSLDKQGECFYKLWTLKESYIKAEGKGNLHNKIELTINNMISNKYIFLSKKLDKYHAVSLCCECSKIVQSDIILDTIAYEELFQWIVNRW